MRRAFLFGSLLLVACRAATAVGQTQGPSSSQTPYLVPTAPGVVTKSILTVGDSVNNKPSGPPYRMVGIPDGLGAFSNGDGTFTLLMNHELAGTAGIARDHGNAGAFVSRWTIAASTLRVLDGRDQIQQVFTYSPAVGYVNSTGQTGGVFSRFCSADLASVSAYYNPASGLGTQARIFMNGEENGAEGRAMAHIAGGLEDGRSYDLPGLGKFSRENSLANPFAQDKTIVAGNDDSSGGQVYFYVGNKTNSGSEIDRAGLTNGILYGLKVEGTPNEDRLNGIGAGVTSRNFSLAALGDVRGLTGNQLQSNSVAAGVTGFLRPEDGAWDPSHLNNYYFVTTDQYDSIKDGFGSQVGRSRLWRASFADITDPTKGGVLDMLLDGTGPYNSFDNIAIDRFGRIILLEDTASASHNGKVWQYDINTSSLTMLLMHDPARFGDIGISAAAPFTTDEESSGVIDASDLLGPGWFLIDVQAHYPIGGELVEGGQLLAFYSPIAVPEPSSLVLLAVGGTFGLTATRRRRVAASRA